MKYISKPKGEQGAKKGEENKYQVSEIYKMFRRDEENG